MRRILSIASIVIVAMFTLAACAPLVPEEAPGISVYATFYPLYALTDALMDGVPNASLHCLVQPQDGCLRSYTLSDWDAALLASSADAVISGGRGLESFESTLFDGRSPNPAVSAVLYNLELYNQGISHAQEENDSHLDGANPHLYMSADGAKRMVESIAATLMTLDPDYADAYAANAESASEELDALSERMRQITADFAGRGVILMNETLIYLAQDCGLETAAWIDRENGEMLYDAEFDECLETLADTDARVVLIERQAPAGLVEALEEAGYSVASIDIFTTHREGEGFDTYLQAQQDNAAAIRDAFIRADRREAN